MQLSETQMKFIRRWGDMGTRWGIPRSTAMLHGLLYVAQEPLTAEEMCEMLQLARSNVSTSLKELEGYNLVYRESRPGDRRSFYRAEADVWEMARRILEERRRRETAGAVQAVEECLAAARSEGDSLLYASGRNIGLYPYSVPLPFFPRSLLPSSVACTNGKRVLLSKRYNIAARVMSSRHSVRARAEMWRRFYHVAAFHFSTALHISILRLRGSLPQDLLCIAA